MPRLEDARRSSDANTSSLLITERAVDKQAATPGDGVFKALLA